MGEKSQWALCREGIRYSIRLNKGETSIGRMSTCAIAINSIFCSRLHCKLFLDAGNVTLEDCSSNGTFINDRKVLNDKISLKENDRIGIGVFDVSEKELQSATFHVYCLKNVKCTGSTSTMDKTYPKLVTELNANTKISKLECIGKHKKKHYIQDKNIINPFNRIVTRSYIKAFSIRNSV